MNKAFSRFLFTLLAFSSLLAGLNAGNVQQKTPQSKIEVLTNELEAAIVSRDRKRSDDIAVKIVRELPFFNNGKSDLSKTYYLLGVNSFFNNDFSAANEKMEKSLSLIKQYPSESTEKRVRRFKGYILLEMGEYAEAIAEMEQFIIMLENSSSVDISYIFDANYIIIRAATQLGLMNRMKSALNDYLRYERKFPGLIDAGISFQIEIERAGAYFSNYEFRKAQMYFESAIRIYRENNLNLEREFTGALSDLGASSFYTGDISKCLDAYKSCYTIADSFPDLYVLTTRSYAIVLGETGEMQEGRNLMEQSLDYMEHKWGKDRFYYELLTYYATYLSEYKLDYNKSIQINKECLGYLKSSNYPERYIWPILLSVSQSLAWLGENKASIDTIDSLFGKRFSWYKPRTCVSDSEIALVEPGRDNYDLFIEVSDVFNTVYHNTGDTSFLRRSAFLAAGAASIMERIKLSIGNEEGQLISGTRYRDSYIQAIKGFSEYYLKSGKPGFTDLAFSFSERSKASSLLSSARQSKAARLNIPEALLEEEKSLNIQIGKVNVRIDTEKEREKPDSNILNSLYSKLAVVNLKKDSLLNYMENTFPEYVKERGDLSVVTPREIAALARRQDFLSYVVTDSIIYTFLINRNGLKLFSIKSGNDFLENVTEFRRLISEPDKGTDAASDEYVRFQELGYKLYKMLILPAREHLISDKLIISPDNILSFFPFELLLSDSTSYNDCYYSRLPFLMKDFRVSYSYSGTLLKERTGLRPGFMNRTLAIAPFYKGQFNIDSTLSSRQAMEGNLPVLKYSPEEATFVSEITGGKLLLGKDATEARFKRESSSAEIIHLAMHTLLDARNPANSRMLFTQESDSTEDNNLQPFEINSLKLNSRMVVLSSCFTGNGLLFSGEGVLSIARSFIIAGSSSVVMSLWEVHDRSGTDIMKSFYKYLKRGYSKSSALRKARLDYLSNSGQVESHPYFWSTLVIYGDDSPVYIPSTPFIISGLILLAAGLLIWFFRYRRP